MLKNDSMTVFCECKCIKNAVYYGSKSPRRNTISYTIEKIKKAMGSENKKMLYFTTSNYIVGKKDKQTTDLYNPGLPKLKNNLVNTEIILEAFPNNEWVEVWQLYFQNIN